MEGQRRDAILPEISSDGLTEPEPGLCLLTGQRLSLWEPAIRDTRPAFNDKTGGRGKS